MADVDIVIPVYNEGHPFLAVVEALRAAVKSRFRILVCYDREDDTTLEALRSAPVTGVEIALVRNASRGPHAAVLAGFAASTAQAVIVFPGDDDYNAGRIDTMVLKARDGSDIVVASRLMRGGMMVGAPLLKAVLVRISAFVLHRVAGLPTHDPSNGFRLFSRRIIERIEIESTQGFTYSIELLVKCHRLGWPIAEIPAEWHERTHGTSRFRLLKWVPSYLRWFLYALATRYALRGPKTVRLRETPR